MNCSCNAYLLGQQEVAAITADQGPVTLSHLFSPSVWSSGDCSADFPARHLVDGDTNTLWVGNPGGSPWSVTVDLDQTTDVSAIAVLFYGAPWTNFGLAGSADATTWFDLATLTNGPLKAHYLYLNLWDPTGSNVPAVREIEWGTKQDNPFG